MRDDLCYMNRNIESVFVEVDKKQINKDKDAIVGVIYKPPDTDIGNFNAILQDILLKIKQENKYPYFLGDYNINLLNIDKHAPSHEFTETMFAHGTIPAINKPTRVTNHSATLIDNIFCQIPSNTNQTMSGIFYSDITDHFSIFYIEGSTVSSLNSDTIKKGYTQLKTYKILKFS